LGGDRTESHAPSDHDHAGRDGQRGRAADVIHASEITRIEVLADMRPTEEDGTRALLSTLVWRPVDTEIAQEARALARQWLPRSVGQNLQLA